MARALTASLLAVLLAGCSSPIVHELDEAEANQILALLQQRGVAAEKVRALEGNRTTYTIQVGRAQAASAWQLLRQENLPRPKPPGVSELFGKPGLVPTVTQERTLAHHALSGELARTLQALEGVLEARVHLVLPSRDPLSPPDAPQPSPRASVLVRVASGAGELDQQAVQRLVAGSIDGLRPDAVTVVVSRAPSPSPAAAPAELVRLGPFLVGAASRAALRAVLAGGLVLLLALCVALILLARRQRALLRAGATSPRRDTEIRPAALESSLGLLSRSLKRGQGKDHG
jgi:type III secretion protein J